MGVRVRHERHVLLLSLYLQEIQGYGPGPAGLRLVPLTLAIMAASPVAGRLVARHGPLSVVGTGYLVTGTALVLALVGHRGRSGAESAAQAGVTRP